MNAHLVQFDMAWEKPQDNYITMERLLSAAPVSAGDLVLAPEMCDTGFSFNVSKTADASGATLAFFAALARRYSVTVQGGRTVRSASGAYHNVMTVVDAQGAVVCEYAKVHPFMRENDAIAPGHALATADLAMPAQGVLRICPAICYDLRFPELFRHGVKLGAHAFTIGACWPTIRLHHWRALLIARAIENQSYVLGVNRIGADPFTSYTGGTIAIGPRGDVLGELKDEEGVLTVPLALGEVAAWREAFPVLRDIKMI
jgi:omega-amidase